MREIVSIMFVIVMLVSTLTGCGTKAAEALAQKDLVESIEKDNSPSIPIILPST